MLDIRHEPSVTITDTYTKEGAHLGSVCKTESGQIVWEDGPTPSKNVCLLPWHKQAPWLRYWRETE